MSVQQVRLESVRRKSGGRIHLTPRVPKSGPVTTLCGQTLAAGTFAAVDDNADCTNCQRRSKDQGRISGAFFAQEEGSELLQSVALVLIGGLVTSTLLTLVFVPAMYTIFDDVQELVVSLVRRRPWSTVRLRVERGRLGLMPVPVPVPIRDTE